MHGEIMEKKSVFQYFVCSIVKVGMRADNIPIQLLITLEFQL